MRTPKQAAFVRAIEHNPTFAQKVKAPKPIEVFEAPTEKRKQVVAALLAAKARMGY